MINVRSIVTAVALLLAPAVALTTAARAQTNDPLMRNYGLGLSIRERAGIYVNRDAQAALQQCDAAYAGLSALSATVQVREVGTDQPVSLYAAVSFRRPDRIRIAYSSGEMGADERIAGTDGQFLFVPDPATGAMRRVPPMAAPGLMVSSAIRQADPLRLTHLGALLEHEQRTLSNVLLPQLKTLRVDSSETIDGVPTVVLTGEFLPRAGGGTLRLALGRDDHLVRQIMRSYSRGDATVVITETYHDVRANPTIADSEFGFNASETGAIVGPAISTGSEQAAIAMPATAVKPADLPAESTVSLPTLTNAGLAVVAQDDAKVLQTNVARFDFGNRNLLDGVSVHHIFRLRNVSQVPVVLQRVSVSCGCVSASLLDSSGAPSVAPVAVSTGALQTHAASAGQAAAPAAATGNATASPPPVLRGPGGMPLPAHGLIVTGGPRSTGSGAVRPAMPAAVAGGLTLMPGQEAPVDVAINFLRTPAGPLHNKYALVWVAGQGVPAVALEMVGQSTDPITFSPEYIDAGVVKAGAARSFAVTAAFDPRFLHMVGGPPPLVTYARGVHVSMAPVATVNAGAAHDGTEPAASAGPLRSPARFGTTLRSVRTCRWVNWRRRSSFALRPISLPPRWTHMPLR
jgi:outer membrane lipoprotein-sorting protein